MHQTSNRSKGMNKRVESGGAHQNTRYLGGGNEHDDPILTPGGNPSPGISKDFQQFCFESSFDEPMETSACGARPQSRPQSRPQPPALRQTRPPPLKLPQTMQPIGRGGHGPIGQPRPGQLMRPPPAPRLRSLTEIYKIPGDVKRLYSCFGAASNMQFASQLLDGNTATPREERSCDTILSQKMQQMLEQQFRDACTILEERGITTDGILDWSIDKINSVPWSRKLAGAIHGYGQLLSIIKKIEQHIRAVNTELSLREPENDQQTYDAFVGAAVLPGLTSARVHLSPGLYQVNIAVVATTMTKDGGKSIVSEQVGNIPNMRISIDGDVELRKNSEMCVRSPSTIYWTIAQTMAKTPSTITMSVSEI